MKSYVFYVEDSTPKYKEFKTLKKAEQWAAKYKVDEMCGDWIEAVFEGKLTFVDEGREKT